MKSQYYGFQLGSLAPNFSIARSTSSVFVVSTMSAILPLSVLLNMVQPSCPIALSFLLLTSHVSPVFYRRHKGILFS